MATLVDTDQAAAAYDRLAPYYDEFTAGYAHDQWVAAIEQQAIAFGLRGHRALDVACGTGKSTWPLLSRGYSVLACDISPEMVREARRKFPQHADTFFVADARSLPRLGHFDFVLCLDDALNYLLTDGDLQDALANIAAILADDGVFAFDLNSLATYRSSFARAIVRDGAGVFFAWRGETSETLEPGEEAAATVEFFTERPDGLWERHASRHVQRHHPPERVRAALSGAGLECCGVWGQLPGARLEPYADDEQHIKLVYFARRARRPRALARQRFGETGQTRRR